MARHTTSGARFFLLFRDYVLLRSSTSSTARPCLNPRAAALTANRPFTTTRQALAAKPPAPAPTHYDLFPATFPAGPPPGGPFAVDERRLRAEFLRLQARAHPDAHRAAADKARAEGASALLNEAYRTLRSPLLRAQYLLALRGVDVAADETAKVEDAELLAEVLEVRELIEEAREEADLKGLKAENDERAKVSVEKLREAFEKDDMEGAKEEAVRLRYWENIGESIKEWEPGKPVVLHH